MLNNQFLSIEVKTTLNPFSIIANSNRRGVKKKIVYGKRSLGYFETFYYKTNFYWEFVKENAENHLKRL